MPYTSNTPFTRAKQLSTIQTDPDADTINKILAMGSVPTFGGAALTPPPVHKGYWATFNLRTSWIDPMVYDALAAHGAIEKAAIAVDDAIAQSPDLAEAARRLGIHSRLQAALWGLYVGDRDKTGDIR